MAVLLLITALLPVILTLINIPFHLPLTIGPITRDFYNEIDKLPKGSIIAFANFDTYDRIVGERDVYRALLRHIFRNNLKLICCSFAPTTNILYSYALEYSGVVKMFNLVEGEDYVIFPFLAGEETALAAAAANFPGTYATDNRGVAVNNIPLMQKVSSLRDVQLTITFGTSFTQVDMFVRQWPAAYGVRSINMQVYSTSASYYGRFVFGDLDGTRGYTEYEALTGYSGDDLIRMDARNLQGLLVFAAMALGNITYFATRSTKAKVDTKEGR
jgi:hypothetical protein